MSLFTGAVRQWLKFLRDSVPAVEVTELRRHVSGDGFELSVRVAFGHRQAESHVVLDDVWVSVDSNGDAFRQQMIRKW